MKRLLKHLSKYQNKQSNKQTAWTANPNSAMYARTTEKRGEFASNDARLKLWISFELAAIKIQRVYRCWKFSHSFRNSISRRLLRRDWKPISFPNLPESFKSIINEESNYEEKMCFWRSIIELRRAHPTFTTDLLIKSLIESKGDAGRSITLLGTKEFVMVNGSELSGKVRKLLLPQPSLRHRNIHSNDPFVSENVNIIGSYDQSNYSNNRTYGTATINNTIQNNMKATNNIELIRSLREKKRIMQKNELFEILHAVLSKSYFSKNHTRGKDKQLENLEIRKTQKLPNAHTVRAKYAQQQKVEMVQTMNQLHATMSGNWDFGATV